MLQEKIKETVLNYNTGLAGALFHYAYGKDHWQNLADHPKDDNKPFVERNKYFKLLWVDDDPTHNSYSAIERIKFDGELLILASSKFTDPTYEYKYENHIKNLKQLAYEFHDKLLDCNDWSISYWKIIEVENLYDNNLDGIMIKFSMSINV